MLISGNNRYSRNKNHGMDPFPGFSLGVFPLYPTSRGTTILKVIILGIILLLKQLFIFAR